MRREIIPQIARKGNLRQIPDVPAVVAQAKEEVKQEVKEELRR
jgi:hypothetical protein